MFSKIKKFITNLFRKNIYINTNCKPVEMIVCNIKDLKKLKDSEEAIIESLEQDNVAYESVIIRNGNPINVVCVDDRHYVTKLYWYMKSISKFLDRNDKLVYKIGDKYIYVYHYYVDIKNVR